jgi:DDE family transposase
MTEVQVIAIYCFCDDFLKARGHQDWPNVKMTLAEIMLVYIVATRFFYGNIERAYKTLKDGRYIGKGLSKGQLNVRLHGIDIGMWHDLIRFAYEQRQLLGLSKEFVVDSFPINVCRNIRISRCRIYEGEEFRGYNTSKREYFYGLKVNMIATAEGQPFEVMLCPGKYHDSEPFKLMRLDLPEGSNFYADSAYTDYEKEEELKKRGIRVIIERKANSCRPHLFEDWQDLKRFRRTIETTFSQISALLPKKIHAVTDSGFELKVIGFVIALAINFVFS